MKSRTRKGAQTMADIARLAGVSKPTVSRALHDSPLVTPETRRHVQEIALRHGYAVNRNAQNLRRRRSNTIVVVIDFPSLPERRISDPFHFELLANITNALAVRDQDVLLCPPKHPEDRSYRTMLSTKGADGIIFVGQGGRHEVLRELARTSVPFVVWGAQLDGAGYCVVGSDNHRGGVLVGKRFAELGRRRVLFLGPLGHPEIDRRRAGLADGLAVTKTGTRIENLVVPDLSHAASLDAMRERLRGPSPAPDAIFAASDTMAFAAVAALQERGVGIPSDCTVAGYDDSPSATYHSPALTTIRQDTRLAGAVLVESLMQMLEGARPRSVLLPTQLVVRGT